MCHSYHLLAVMFNQELKYSSVEGSRHAVLVGVADRRISVKIICLVRTALCFGILLSLCEAVKDERSADLRKN